MNRVPRPILLLAILGLLGCTAQMPPPSVPLVAPPAAQTPPPQSSAEQPYFSEAGMASFYGASQDGNTTANGDTFDQRSLTAAHRTLAFGTVVRVTNIDNGHSVKVSINDRGPHVKERIIDLSYAAARALGMTKNGVVQVRVEAFHSDQGS
jgi:rare lipoprotein A